MNIMIRRAEDKENEILTLIAFEAKRYWKYPEEYFDVWKDELTITADYINKNEVHVAKVDGKSVGFISIVEVENDFLVGDLLIRKGFWLDHIFVHPSFIRNRVGSELIFFAKKFCEENNIICLHILSDPNAKGFYDRIGAQFIEEVPSNIKGRTVSLYKFPI
ncbi:GNAT family N-acetyltransferase [Desulfosporosinus nitroreducens]|uniref:GNAT family N-acetyltransferase n=1 Tax=Desulfosporosinus nitroreducens TaxID=2018668 RepID=A0ABT8QS30_9FIRM|nr:GNAT family N-acetyltransferase [Desulfosporosinus nitroreducens]MDO0824136.1 GNAT family N-acetyltransferase [Desulfosporosinus nitroreducens]